MQTQSFSLNPKCIGFSFACMGLFLACPSFTNAWVAALALYCVFVVAYVGMAWYDYRYGCSVAPLRRGNVSFTGIFKPPAHEAQKQKPGAEEKYGPQDALANRMAIYASHLLLIAPFLMYMAWVGKSAPKQAYWLMGALAAMTAVYHGSALMQALKA